MNDLFAYLFNLSSTRKLVTKWQVTKSRKILQFSYTKQMITQDLSYIKEKQLYS